MGHYRSEMGYEDQDRIEAEQQAKRRAATTAELQRAIDERGIAAVLADIILDTSYSTSIGGKYKRW